MAPQVSVIIPARNEARRIGACLDAILAQDSPAYDIIVVDDQSDDDTAEQVRAIQARNRESARVRLVSAGPLPAGWVGKSHAVAVGSQVARGDWLLFLDADTHVMPQGLTRAVARAEAEGLDGLSLSPEQVCEGFWERVVQPVVFEFLNARYDLDVVNDPARPEAAANGQFILIRRTVYERLGGHEAIKDRVLEDVAFAERAKRSGVRLAFYDGRGLARTRMYESFGDLWRGWTKMLFLLCGGRVTTVAAAAGRAGLHALPLAVFPLALWCWWAGHPPVRDPTVWALLLLLAAVYVRARFTLRRLGFPSATSTLGYPVGCALFVGMLAASAARGWSTGRVTWRGRAYSISPTN